MGDYVIVINLEKVVLTANKEKKIKFTTKNHSGYPGGLKHYCGKLRVKITALVQKAVAGMLHLIQN